MIEAHNYDDYLAHHGVLGMKWGVRRYQNKDGSYTEAGKKRHSESISSSTKKKIAAAALAAGTIAVAAIYASKHPEQIKSVIGSVKNIAVNKVAPSVKKGADYVAKFGKDSLAGLKQGYKEGVETRRNILLNRDGYQTNKKNSDGTNTEKKGNKFGRVIGNYAGQVKEVYAYGLRTAPMRALEGTQEALINAPRAVAKGIVGGAAIIACRKLMNDALGENNVDNYTKAYNAYNKKNKIGNFKAKLFGKDNDEEDDED